MDTRYGRSEGPGKSPSHATVTEAEFNRAYQLLFGDDRITTSCLLRIRELDQGSLKQAYRRRVQQTHPDRSTVKPTALDPDAEFRSVVAAYELLRQVQQKERDVSILNTAVLSRKVTRASGGLDQALAKATAAAKAASVTARQMRWANRAAGKPEHRPQNSAPEDKSRHARTPKTAATSDVSGAPPQPGPRQGQQGFESPSDSKEPAAKFSPDSAHYCSQPMPPRPLPLGQFLYYSGRISWRQLIDALVWQRKHRPMIGRVARERGLLTQYEVDQVLNQRRAEGQRNMRFADMAEQMGLLSSTGKTALFIHMTLLQKPLGEYFVQQGVLTENDLFAVLSAHRRHNLAFENKRA